MADWARTRVATDTNAPVTEDTDTLRAAFNGVRNQNKPGIILHPKDYAEAEQKGYIVDGKLQWDAILRDFLL